MAHTPSANRPHPPRRPRPSRATIIRRRLVALVILLALVGLIAFGVTRLVQALTAPAAPEPAPTQAASAAPEACAGADVSLEAKAHDVIEGEGGDVVVSVTNDGEQPCTLEAGREELVLTVSSGGQLQWDSSVCQSEPVHRPLLLDAHSSSDVTMTWDGTAPGGDICPTERRIAAPGTYRVAVALDGRLGAEATVIVQPDPEAQETEDGADGDESPGTQTDAPGAPDSTETGQSTGESTQDPAEEGSGSN